MGLIRIVTAPFKWVSGVATQAAALTRYLTAPVRRATINIQEVVRSECILTHNTLRQQSPVATRELANSWTVTPIITPAPNIFLPPTVQVTITNTAPNYLYRVAGRAPGKPPPYRAIRQWCLVKGIDPAAAYPIAKTIGKKGTKRWQRKINVLNYDPVALIYNVPNVWTDTVNRINRRLA